LDAKSFFESDPREVFFIEPGLFLNAERWEKILSWFGGAAKTDILPWIRDRWAR